MSITVCISDAGDDRLWRTLSSLGRQTMVPSQVLIERRGTVAESRNLMFRQAKGDILVFLDTDQEAPPWWLEALTWCIRNGIADFTCGPTRGHPEPAFASQYQEYFAEIEHRHYKLCELDQTAFPMGNSAWSRKVMLSLAQNADYAPFDESFKHGGEDYDVNIRATKLGYHGLFIPEAWVWHDQSSLNNPLKIMRRKLWYCYGGAKAQLKNGHLDVRLARRIQVKPYAHWLEAFQKVAQVVGFAAAKLA